MFLFEDDIIHMTYSWSAENWLHAEVYGMKFDEMSSAVLLYFEPGNQGK